jgi:hypothetical protein
MKQVKQLKECVESECERRACSSSQARVGDYIRMTLQCRYQLLSVSVTRLQFPVSIVEYLCLSRCPVSR